MSRQLWVPMSGAIAKDQLVDTIANNLANMNTQGFKADDVTFKEVLARSENPNPNPGIPRSPIKDKDLYPIEGRDQAFTMVSGTHTNFRQGGLKVTENPLDIALEGPGFLEVATPKGIRFTRLGSLKLGADGRLVTSQGYPVLSARTDGTIRGPASQNSDPQARLINLSGRDGGVHINELGELYMQDDQVAKLSIVEFENGPKLKKVGDGLYENIGDPATNPEVAATQTNVRQGMIEQSNVNPVEEMTKLIKANRMFEMDLKAMKTVDSMLGKEVNDIGKF
jgi:flagellar basal-body rod protein FlgF